MVCEMYGDCEYCMGRRIFDSVFANDVWEAKWTVDPKARKNPIWINHLSIPTIPLYSAYIPSFQ